MPNDIERVLQLIAEAFPRLDAPLPEWKGCDDVDDFLRKFGNDFFYEFWPHMYDDIEVTRFLLRFALKYYLQNHDAEQALDSADYFISRLDPEAQNESQLNWRVEELFNSLSERQQQVICEWLTVMEKNYPLLLATDGAKKYWCKNVMSTRRLC